MGSVLRKFMVLWLRGEVKVAIAAAVLLIGGNDVQAGEDQRLSAAGVSVLGSSISFGAPLCVLSAEIEAGGGHHLVTVDAAGKLRADTISAKSVTVVGLLGRDACPQHSIFFDIAQATNWAVEEGEAP